MLKKDYYGQDFQVIDVIQLFGLGFERGNMIKYVARAGLKDTSKYHEDFDKAFTYYEFYIDKRFEFIRNLFIRAMYLYVKTFKRSKFEKYTVFLNSLDRSKKNMIEDIINNKMLTRDFVHFKKMLHILYAPIITKV